MISATYSEINRNIGGMDRYVITQVYNKILFIESSWWVYECLLQN